MIIENTAKIKLDVFKYNSFEFTERHLEQNREALEVRSQPSSSLQATSGSSQDGSGQLDPTFVSRIASLVQAEITKNKFNEDKKSATLLPVVSNYRSYERSNPLEAVVLPAKTLPPQRFDTQVFQNSMNDAFDHQRLLKKVPKQFQSEAKSILDALNDQSNDLTWDSVGTIYIDQQAIPNSDIYDIFPRLFKKQKPKRMPGFLEFEKKLQSMNLNHFLENSKQSGKGNLSAQKIECSEQWWYIGP